VALTAIRLHGGRACQLLPIRCVEDLASLFGAPAVDQLPGATLALELGWLWLPAFWCKGVAPACHSTHTRRLSTSRRVSELIPVVNAHRFPCRSQHGK